MIGVFDSGSGGLTVQKCIVERLPQYRYMYLGDNARAPYGNRTPEEVYTFTKQGVDFLTQRGCTLIIIACNTSSAEALRKIQQEYVSRIDAPKVLGVIVPAVEEAVAMTRNNRIGVIATEGTVRSNAFVREIQHRNSQALVFQNAAPLLVPLIEANEHHSSEIETILREYLRPLQREAIDTLILGCTHYGHVEAMIRDIVGDSICIVSEGSVVAERLTAYLTRHIDIESKLSREGGVTFYSTDTTERFQTLATLFLGTPITPEHVVLGS